MDSNFAVVILNALAHEHRLAVFRLLVQAGPGGLPAGNISAEIGISPASMSFHLKDLVQADLIAQRHEGRKIFYSARFETMNAVVGYLAENCCGGNPCLPASMPICKTDAIPG
ncbi:MAG: metalloregulator ArsR/SmtB family transcription factor [Pseudomonadota bacterium]